MPTIIHTCTIEHGDGGTIRIVAERSNRRPLLADFTVEVFQRKGDNPEASMAKAAIVDFPRALGAEGLFANVLRDLSTSKPNAIDENGASIGMPETTPAQWKRQAERYCAMAVECERRAGLLGPEIIEQADRQMKLPLVCKSE